MRRKIFIFDPLKIPARNEKVFSHTRLARGTSQWRGTVRVFSQRAVSRRRCHLKSNIKCEPKKYILIYLRSTPQVYVRGFLLDVTLRGIMLLFVLPCVVEQKLTTSSVAGFRRSLLQKLSTEKGAVKIKRKSLRLIHRRSRNQRKI